MTSETSPLEIQGSDEGEAAGIRTEPGPPRPLDRFFPARRDRRRGQPNRWNPLQASRVLGGPLSMAHRRFPK